jgi:hypothetical protein
MRAGRIVVLTALVVGVMAGPAHATPHFTVGQGQNPGAAIDAAGTAYIGWQVNTHAGTGDTVQLCVLPAGARACASLAAVRSRARAWTSGAPACCCPRRASCR